MDQVTILETLIQQKMEFLSVAASIYMQWWTAATLFCGSIFAATYIQRKSLLGHRAIYMHGFFAAVFVFICTVIGFGLFGISMVSQLESELIYLLGLMNITGLSFGEYDGVRRGIAIGTTSFCLLLAVWIGLYVRIWQMRKDAHRKTLAKAKD